MSNRSQSDNEVPEFEDTLNSSLANRLSLFVKHFGVDKRKNSGQGSGVSIALPNFWNRLIIVPRKNRKYRLWVKFVLLWALFSSFFTPFEFGFFRGLPHKFEWIDQVGQVVFLIDIAITFLVAFKDMHTYTWVTDHRSIALRYAKTSLLLDLLGCFPWDRIYKASGRKEAVRYLLWVRLYRVRKVTAFFQNLEKNIRINYMLTRIAKLIAVELYCTHTAACIFYYLATTLRAEQEGYTWIGSLGLGSYDYENFREIHLGRRYVTSLYWAILTMSTVGYGDIHAVNVREMIFVMVFVSFDMILGAYLIGNMTALIVKGSNTERFRDKMTSLIKYMNRHSLRRDLRSPMKSHLQLQYESKFTENGILEDLPSSIRAKVLQSLYLNTVERVPFFRNCSQEFCNQIVTRVSEEIFLPGEVIMEQGSIVDQLYIVCSGSLEEVFMNMDGSEEIITNLKDLNVFGEVALLCNICQPYTVRVCELCKLLRIDKQTFLHLLQVYFLDGRQILNNILKDCSSGACERNWSAHALVHTKRRNRLSTSQIERLIYCRENMRIMHKFENLTGPMQNKDTDARLRQLESEISVFITREEEVLAFKLNLAAYHGNFVQLQNLVKAIADVNKTDYSGRTPLHLAAAMGHEQIVRFLIKEGANVNCIDNDGITPLYEALKGSHDHVATLLLEAGAQLLLENPSIQLQNTIKSGNLEFLRRLLKHKVDPNSKDYQERTALHLAAAEGSHLFASELINYGGNIHQPDRWGKTPLDEARRCGKANRVLSLFESTCEVDFKNVGRNNDDGGISEFCEEVGKEIISSSPSYENKRCTVFACSWTTPSNENAGKRGLVVWVPLDLTELLGIASHHFGLSFAHVVNHDGGQILHTDIIQDGDKVFMLAE